MTQLFSYLAIGICDLISRYALCAMPSALFWSAAGFYAYATNIMAEMEGFGKIPQLLVTSQVIKFLLT